MPFAEFPAWCDVTRGKYGIYLVNPNDAYVGTSLLAYGEFSDGEVALFQDILKPGWVVVEVGANIGALTLPIARLVGPGGLVIALEPQRPCFLMLAGMCAVNNLTNVLPIWAAAGDHTRTFLHVPRLDPTKPNNFGGLELGGDAPAGDFVWCPTLHDLLYTLEVTRRVDFLKLDVEGMEPQVLTGAESLLNRDRPICYVECDRADREHLVRAIFETHQYDLWWHLPPLFNPKNFRNQTENQFGQIVSANLLAVPREQGFDPPAAWECKSAVGYSVHAG